MQEKIMDMKLKVCELTLDDLDEPTIVQMHKNILATLRKIFENDIYYTKLFEFIKDKLSTDRDKYTITYLYFKFFDDTEKTSSYRDLFHKVAAYNVSIPNGLTKLVVYNSKSFELLNQLYNDGKTEISEPIKSNIDFIMKNYKKIIDDEYVAVKTYIDTNYSKEEDPKKEIWIKRKTENLNFIFEEPFYNGGTYIGYLFDIIEDSIKRYISIDTKNKQIFNRLKSCLKVYNSSNCIYHPKHDKMNKNLRLDMKNLYYALEKIYQGI